MIGVGVIGYGYWGPNLVRNFVETRGTKVRMVSDLREERLSLVQDRYPGVQVTPRYNELINAPDVDVVAIATPVSTHYDLTMQALRAGKNVLVEKPMAETHEQCLKMQEEAGKRNLLLMVDHTYVYTEAVNMVKRLIDHNDLGTLFYYDSVRINLGLFQRDVNVIWDLAVHDLAIMDYIFQGKPCAVSATGMSHIPNQPANTAFLTLFYNNCFISHIHVSWLAPVKVRRTLIGGLKKMIVFDDLEPSEKIKIYDKGITLNESSEEGIYKMLIGYRSGDMWVPQLNATEALRTEVQHLIRCLTTQEQPLADAKLGARVVKIMEAADRSLAQKGKLVEFELE
jgi:predicted dehydrogenase